MVNGSAFTVEVSKCFNKGEINSLYIYGGIVGGLCHNDSLIDKCFNDGNINSVDTEQYGHAGGIVGDLCRASNVTNCYNTGNIDGAETVGGIVAYTFGGTGEISNCYNIGNITGNSQVGGILGGDGASYVITNTYYLINTASKGVGTVDSGTDLSANKEFLQTTFVETANLEETIWKVENDKYPELC